MVGGGGDQPAGAVGNGIVRQGVVSATMGTSGVVFAHTQRNLATTLWAASSRGCHSGPGAWHVHGSGPGGRRKLSVVPQRASARPRSRPASKRQGVDPYFLLSDEAATVGPGAEGLFFLPYLTGERTPHFDPDAKGAWIGLTVRHGRPHMIRSILEGAAYAMRDSLELIREMGTAITQVRVSGGGARNPLWRQIQADIYGHDVHTLESTEGPAFGRGAPRAQVGYRRLHLRPRGVRRHHPARRPDGRRPLSARRASTAPRLYRSIAGFTASLRGSFFRDHVAWSRPTAPEAPLRSRASGFGESFVRVRRPPLARRPRRSKPAPSKARRAKTPATALLPDATGPKPFWNRRRTTLAVVLLLVLHVVLAVRSLVTENPTVDEVAHLPAGVTYWEKGTFRLYHHNPPLVKLVGRPYRSCSPWTD